MADNLDTEKKYNLSAKNANGKYWTHGSLGVTDMGYWRVSFKVTDQLKAMIDANGWINFSVFEDDRDRSRPSASVRPRQKTEVRSQLDDEIPF